MSARHRLPRAPRTDGDGVFAGIVLVAANLFGLGIITAGQAPHSASAAVALDAPPAEDTPDAGPFTAKKDSGPVAPPALPRAAQPACHDAGCPTVPSRPESSDPGGTGRHHQTPPDSVNLSDSAASYESGSGSSNRPLNAITDV